MRERPEGVTDQIIFREALVRRRLNNDLRDWSDAEISEATEALWAKLPGLPEVGFGEGRRKYGRPPFCLDATDEEGIRPKGFYYLFTNDAGELVARTKPTQGGVL